MKQVRVMRVDDIDGGSKAVDTVNFSYQGRMYEIDLSASNRKRMESMLDEFVSHARVKPATRRRRKSNRSNARQVRSWAVDHGIKVGSRGRIPANVMWEYSKSNH